MANEQNEQAQDIQNEQVEQSNEQTQALVLFNVTAATMYSFTSVQS